MNSTSKWNHLLCEECWHRREPTRSPLRIKDDPYAPCCVCRRHTNSGIYIRADPREFRCEGRHQS